MKPRLSAVVTTLDNAATLEACLSSLGFCDEIVLLDSGSADATLEIARRHGARIETQAFAGYGPQKQAAIELATGDWILLLDADEHLTDAGRIAIERELAAPRADGYRLPRQEWLFSDLALLSCGGVSSGIYPTDAASQVEYLTGDSNSVLIFVEDDEQLDKVLEVRERLPLLRRIVVWDMEGLRELHDEQVISFDT